MYSMKFTFAHNNLNVLDLDKSLAFYKEALDLTEVRRKDAEDGSFTLVYLGDGTTPHLLELTWLRDMDRPYNLGDNEIHLAFEVDDFDAAHKSTKKWDVSATKIREWEFTSSLIRMDTGLKLFPKN